MSEETDTARVVQADRDEAALLYDRTSRQSWDSAKEPHTAAGQHILDGKGDGSPYVQAFARHRIAQAAPAGDGREAIFDAAHTFERLRDLTPARANETTASGFHGAIKAVVEAALDRMEAALTARSDDGEAIPTGMVRWDGGESAPADWDGGPVLLEDGKSYCDSPRDWKPANPYRIIAYTPKPTPATGGADREARTSQIAEAIWVGEVQLKTDYPPTGSFADEPDRERFLWLARYVERLAPPAVAAREQRAMDARNVVTGREALKPFLREFDRLEREYGFDRPDHQLQCLMMALSDIKRLRAFAALAQPERNAEVVRAAREEGYRAAYNHVLGLTRSGVPTSCFERDVAAYMADFVSVRP